MSYRKLTIGKDVWEYSVGQGAKIRSPKGKCTWVDGWELMGFESKQAYKNYMWDLNKDEDDCYRHTEPITPKMIKDYIEKNLTKE